MVEASTPSEVASEDLILSELLLACASVSPLRVKETFTTNAGLLGAGVGGIVIGGKDRFGSIVGLRVGGGFLLGFPLGFPVGCAEGCLVG